MAGLGLGHVPSLGHTDISGAVYPLNSEKVLDLLRDAEVSGLCEEQREVVRSWQEAWEPLDSSRLSAGWFLKRKRAYWSSTGVRDGHTCNPSVTTGRLCRQSKGQSLETWVPSVKSYAFAMI